MYFINAAKLPLLPLFENFEGKGCEESARSRAMRFANSIQKPPLKKSLSPG